MPELGVLVALVLALVAVPASGAAPEPAEGVAAASDDAATDDADRDEGAAAMDAPADQRDAWRDPAGPAHPDGPSSRNETEEPAGDDWRDPPAPPHPDGPPSRDDRDAPREEPAARKPGATAGYPDTTMDLRGQQADDDEFAAAAEQARADGRVRVIVGVQARFAPEGAQGPQANASQRAAIRSEQDAVIAELAGTEHRVNRQYATVPYVALSLSPRALEALERSGRAASVQIDELAPPAFDELAPPAVEDSSPLVWADRMWARGYTGTGNMVAILDTGVDSSHPFFGNRVVEEACYSSDDSGTGWTSETLCPNEEETETGTGAGVNCDTSDVAACDHGTHVAGIAAGNGPDFDGVARNAPIMSVQVFSRITSVTDCSPSPSPCILSWTSDQIAGLERVHALRNAHDIAAVNMSLGGGQRFSACDDDDRKPIIDNLRSEDIATVIAAGNRGWSDSVGAPACISTAIAVGSTTKNDVVSNFSNSHPTMVDLYAPGSAINSAVPGGGFQQKNGTSMAAPQVAGAWSVLRHYDSSFTVATLRIRLRNTGVWIEDDRDADSGLHHSHRRIRVEGPAGPRNDNLANNLPINLTYSDTQITRYATTQAGEPTDPSCDSGSIGRTAWYRYAPGSMDADLIADTEGSNFDTFLVAYRQDGSGLGGLTEVACDEGSSGGDLRNSQVEFTAEAGEVYYFQVGGWGTAGGTLVFNNQLAPPDNDDVDDALTVDPLPYSDTRDTRAATMQSHEPDDPSCHVGGIGRTVWYTYTPSRNERLSVDTDGSNFDTFLVAYREDDRPFSGLTEVACDEGEGTPGGPENSVVDFVAESGETYYFQVGGWTGSPGNVGDAGHVVFNVQGPPPPTNVVALAGDGQATVSWDASASDDTVDEYTVTADAGGPSVTVDGEETEAVVDGLTNDTRYRFDVVATHPWGQSPEGLSNPVTPQPGLIVDGGPFVTHVDDGPDGADRSLVQNSLGLTSFGANHRPDDPGWRVSDEFTIEDAKHIDAAELYAYQTDSGTESTITEVNARIWDGPPGATGSEVIWGDTTTNRLVETGWTGTYRVNETFPDRTNRPVMANRVDIGTTLDPGTYWLDWQTDGDLASGPWAPAVTVLGETETGNARQLSGGTWDDILAGGASQGMPFLLFGVPAVVDVEVTPAVTDVPVGMSQAFTATATYSDDSTDDVTADAAWSSDDTDTATIDADGTAAGVAEGTAAITAMFDGVAGSAALTVTEPVVTALEVTPSTAEVPVGETQAFTATATYSDDSTDDVTADAAWSSEDTGTATVDADGIAEGVAPGAVDVTATFDGESDAATLTVTGPEGVFRLFGPGRFETAIEISGDSYGDGQAGSVVLARGDEFADALAGTPLAVDRDAPILLTPSNLLLDIVADEITRVLEPGGTVYLLGGTAALDATVEADLTALGYVPVRLSGAERIATSLAIATELGKPDAILITTGFNFPDALAAGAAAVQAGGAVVLTTPDAPNPAVDAYLAANPATTTYGIGGPAARAYPSATPLIGAAREETAALVADTFFDDHTTIAIARHDAFPDALGGGVHIARLGGPLLLTPTAFLHPASATHMCANHATLTAAYIYGGTAAISPTVADAVNAAIDGTGCQ